MQFSFLNIDLAKFPYCLKSSYGRLLSREPTNPYDTIRKRVWHYYSGKSCMDKAKNLLISCAILTFGTSNVINNSDAYQGTSSPSIWPVVRLIGVGARKLGGLSPPPPQLDTKKCQSGKFSQRLSQCVRAK